MCLPKKNTPVEFCLGFKILRENIYSDVKLIKDSCRQVWYKILKIKLTGGVCYFYFLNGISNNFLFFIQRNDSCVNILSVVVFV